MHPFSLSSISYTMARASSRARTTIDPLMQQSGIFRCFATSMDSDDVDMDSDVLSYAASGLSYAGKGGGSLSMPMLACV